MWSVFVSRMPHWIGLSNLNAAWEDQAFGKALDESPWTSVSCQNFLTILGIQEFHSCLNLVETLVEFGISMSRQKTEYHLICNKKCLVFWAHRKIMIKNSKY